MDWTYIQKEALHLFSMILWPLQEKELVPEAVVTGAKACRSQKMLLCMILQVHKDGKQNLERVIGQRQKDTLDLNSVNQGQRSIRC